jgi:hypothetical protein
MRSTTAVMFAASLLAGFIAARSAVAIDAGDVMGKMKPDERGGFIGGAVDMAAHLYAVAGNRKKADCAVKWFFDDENALREVYKFFDEHKNKDAVGLIAIMIDRKCGK